MAELLYPTDLDLAGPWLITAEQLEALDEVVDREALVLQASADARLANDLDNLIARNYESYPAEKKEKAREDRRSDYQESGRYEVRRDVKVSLQDDKRLSASTFKEVSRHPEIAGSRIVELEMELGNGDTRCTVSIGGRWNENLRLSVSGANQQDRERLFIALRNWVSDCQAPGWQRAWNWVASRWIQWLIWYPLLVISLTVATADSHSPYIDEAHQLLAKGLDSKDLTKTLELILALESHYQPKPDATRIPLFFWLVALGGLLVCIALSIYHALKSGWVKEKLA